MKTHLNWRSMLIVLVTVFYGCRVKVKPESVYVGEWSTATHNCQHHITVTPDSWGRYYTSGISGYCANGRLSGRFKLGNNKFSIKGQRFRILAAPMAIDTISLNSDYYRDPVKSVMMMKIETPFLFASDEIVLYKIIK